MPTIKKIPARKKILLVSLGPTGSGKSVLVENVCKAYTEKSGDDCPNLVALNKDTLTILSNQIFYARHRRVNRSSSNRLFRRYIRNSEYDCIEQIAIDALRFADIVILDAPYSSNIARNIRGESDARLAHLRQCVHAAGGSLIFLYNNITEEIARQRWIHRFATDPAAAARTPKVLKQLDATIEENRILYELDKNKVVMQDADDWFLFDGCDPENSFSGLKSFLGIEADTQYDARIIEARSDSDI